MSSSKGIFYAPQSQEGRLTGIESEMHPQPKFKAMGYVGAGRLANKSALVTGGNSGIGRAVAVLYAREGARVCINYLPEEQVDAEKTKSSVEAEGGFCYLIPRDISSSVACTEVVERAAELLGRLDILALCHGYQRVQFNLLDITDEQLEHTFRINAYTPFYLCRSAVRFMQPGSAVITTSSVSAYKGDGRLMDYSSAQGAVISFTRALSLQFVPREIRVNCVAIGDVWTPNIPVSYPAQLVPSFGHRNLMDRAAQPEDISPTFVFLASAQSSYISGQTIHVNGGVIVNS